MQRRITERILLVVSAAFLFASIFGWYGSTLPEYYESKTVLVIKPPQISGKVVQSLTEEELEQKLATMNQEILSDSTLEPMIAKYKLFETEKAQKMPMELIIEKMRRNIQIEPEKANDGKLIGFSLTYRDLAPEKAQNVVAELAGKYVNQQIIGSVESAEKTREFIEKQLKDAEDQLKKIEKERLAVLTENIEVSDCGQGLIAQLIGLHQRKETIFKENETLVKEKGRFNDSLSALDSQIILVNQFIPSSLGQLAQIRTELKTKLKDLRIQYRDEYPEIAQTLKEIDLVDNEIKLLQGASNARTENQIKHLEAEKQKINGQIYLIDRELIKKEVQFSENNMRIEKLEAKIFSKYPYLKNTLREIEFRYQDAKETFDSLTKKVKDFDLQLGQETDSQGETIRIVAPANLPQSPISPTWLDFTLIGAGFGFFVGLIVLGLSRLANILRIRFAELDLQ